MLGKIWFIAATVLALLLAIAGGVILIAAREETPSENSLARLTIRQPVVAGSYYPADPGELSAQIDEFLAATGKEEATTLRSGSGRARVATTPQILIVPHAGYEYSGQVAAYGFKKLQGLNFNTVIVIAASHHFSFTGAALSGVDAWETPLGQVPVDQNLTEKLSNSNRFTRVDDRILEPEQTIEIEIPFLQRVLGDFKIVPIVLGQEDSEVVEALVNSLAAIFDEKTLLVISSDLSHYPSYDDAVEADNQTIESILTGDPATFGAVISAQMSDGIPNLVTCACGSEAIKVGMKLAERLGFDDIQLLKYANSGDVTEDHGRVVGYASIGFYGESSKFEIPASPPPLAGQAAGGQNSNLQLETKNFLLKAARETLESYIRDHEIPEIKTPEDSQLLEKQGAFVTLKKDNQLRGCIGQILPSEDPLWKVVQGMMVAAATEDSRFPPVTVEELDEIEIEISVLSVPQKITDPEREVELGKHGVIVRRGTNSGVFLPQVADETGWDLETFLGQLCSQKAGLLSSCWRDPQTEIYTFTAEVLHEEV